MLGILLFMILRALSTRVHLEEGHEVQSQSQGYYRLPRDAQFSIALLTERFGDLLALDWLQEVFLRRFPHTQVVYNKDFHVGGIRFRKFLIK